MANNHKKNKLKSWLKSLANFLSSDWFFRLIIAVFILQAVWIALSSIYPGAFDEETHLSIINFFAHHPNPFFTHQPASLNQYGAVVYDSSYLYRYLMAFPWLLIIFAVKSFTIQVIIMRLINVGLFTWGIILFRKLLRRITDNIKLIHVSLLLIILTPIVPQLAAQINYDNLFIPFLVLEFILSIDILKQLKLGKVNLKKSLLFLAFGFLTCLVKYTFLPIFTVMILFLVVQFLRPKSRALGYFEQAKSELANWTIGLKILLIGLLIVSFGLFFERYGLNIIRYRTPTPSCVDVIGAKSCQGYSIYQRNIYNIQNKPLSFNKSPLYFTAVWIKHMQYNLMMTINGPASGYSIGLPLLVPYIASIVLATSGLGLILAYRRRIFNSTSRRLILLSMLLYLLSLWIVNYTEYLHTGRRVAVQGRYLVPFLPFIYLIFLLGLEVWLKTKPQLKTGLISLLVLAFLMGGGVVAFIVHSDDAWYWQGNQSAINMNKTAKRLLKPIIPATHYVPNWQNSLDF